MTVFAVSSAMDERPAMQWSCGHLRDRTDIANTKWPPRWEAHRIHPYARCLFKTEQAFSQTRLR